MNQNDNTQYPMGQDPSNEGGCASVVDNLMSESVHQQRNVSCSHKCLSNKKTRPEKKVVLAEEINLTPVPELATFNKLILGLLICGEPAVYIKKICMGRDKASSGNHIPCCHLWKPHDCQR